MQYLTLQELFNKAVDTSISELSSLWIPYVIQDIDIRYWKENEYRYDEWHDLRIKIANKLVPEDEEEVYRLAKESSLQSLGIIEAIESKYRLKVRNHPFGKGISIKKMLCDLVVDYLQDPKEERFILALTLDKIAKKISIDFDKERFSDENYFIDLINEKNLGFPILFADVNVRDNPEIVKLAFDKAEWYFDMSSQRLKELSKNENPKEVLEKDILRRNLEKSLDQRPGSSSLLKI